MKYASMPSPPDLAGLALTAQVKARARQIGFDLVGVARAERSGFDRYVRQWLDEGRAGTMGYLTRRVEERIDPAAYLPGAASAVCVAINYHVPLQPLPEDDPRPHGRIARYALGDDYHELIRDRLHALADWMRQTIPGCQTRACVDTAPVLEKELAARAGVGWIGKNTCLIHPRVGSWLLLGEILTTAPLAADEAEADHCGNCTRCIDACPTSAITEPYQLDARKCISYLTIEHRDDVPGEYQSAIGDWLYGCDICQDVCPFNRKPPAATDPALQPRFPAGAVDVEALLQWTDEAYREHFRNSAVKRVKLPMLKRNAGIVKENIRQKKEHTRTCAPDADPI